MRYHVGRDPDQEEPLPILVLDSQQHMVVARTVEGCRVFIEELVELANKGAECSKPATS